MKMKKNYALVLLALLIIPVLSVFPVQASTGAAQIGGIDAGNVITIATSNVSVKAGEMTLAKIDGAATTGKNLVIILDNVAFSGAQFDLWFSKDGYSVRSPTDIGYAQAFSVSDLALAPKVINMTNTYLMDGTQLYTIGTISGHKVVVGPIPFDISAEYKYVKIYDGSATLVAVALQTIEALPSLTLTPTSGPAGTSVTLSAVCLAASKLVNITYTSPSSIVGLVAQVMTGADGKLTNTWAIADLKNDYNSYVHQHIYIDLIYNSTPGTIDSVNFAEYSRVFMQIIGETTVTNQGNLTGQVDVTIFGDLIVAGNYFYPGAVDFKVDGTTLGTVTANGTGFFNTTFTVPILAKGLHNVTATNNGVLYIFKVNALPTLVVTPKSGPIGTVVTISAYGFTADSLYYLYWKGLTCGDALWYNIMNATTGSDGQFNVTTTYTVPAQNGGSHAVAAATAFDGSTNGNVTLPHYFASGSFKVTPSSLISPATITNNGLIFSAIFTGLDCTKYYVVDMDNQWMNPGANWDVRANSSGDLQIDFIAAGFRPGLHVVSLYSEDSVTTGVYTPATFATFTVDTANDVLWSALDARLVSLEGTIATIDTNVGLVKTSVDAINATVTSIDDGIATVQTSLGTLTGTVTTISGDIATVKTDIGTVLAKVTTGPVPIDMMPIWLAVILAAVAAIAAIIAIFMIRSKIAA